MSQVIARGALNGRDPTGLRVTDINPLSHRR